MFITRASRHDRDEVSSFLETQGRTQDPEAKGTVFFAREGAIAGVVRLVEVAPQVLVIDEMVVDEARRRRGIGTALMQAAMNSRGGTLYVSTDPTYTAFFARVGFDETDPQTAPEVVAQRLAASGDPSETVVMKAR